MVSTVSAFPHTVGTLQQGNSSRFHTHIHTAAAKCSMRTEASAKSTMRKVGDVAKHFILLSMLPVLCSSRDMPHYGTRMVISYWLTLMML